MLHSHQTASLLAKARLRPKAPSAISRRNIEQNLNSSASLVTDHRCTVHGFLFSDWVLSPGLQIREVVHTVNQEPNVLDVPAQSSPDINWYHAHIYSGYVALEGERQQVKLQHTDDMHCFCKAESRFWEEKEIKTQHLRQGSSTGAKPQQLHKKKHLSSGKQTLVLLST